MDFNVTFIHGLINVYVVRMIWIEDNFFILFYILFVILMNHILLENYISLLSYGKTGFLFLNSCFEFEGFSGTTQKLYKSSKVTDFILFFFEIFRFL